MQFWLSGRPRTMIPGQRGARTAECGLVAVGVFPRDSPFGLGRCVVSLPVYLMPRVAAVSCARVGLCGPHWAAFDEVAG